MSLRTNISILLTAGFLILFGGILTAVSAQDGEDLYIDDEFDLFLGEATIFVELHLSPEGIYGVDSNGTEWEYDFSRDEFVDEELNDYRSSTSTTFGRTKSGFDRAEMARLEKLAELEGLEALSPEQIARISEHAFNLAEQALVKRYKGLQLRAVTVEVGEVVNGSISSIGEVTVKGTVHGDVISYSRVTITSDGFISGDVRAPEIVKMRGGTIMGVRHESDLPPPPDFIDIDIFNKTSYTALIVILVLFFSFIFFSLIGIGVASKPIDRVHHCLKQHLFLSFFVGFGGWFALGPLMAILVLTIIGIPVAVLVLPIALIAGIILGVLGAAQLTGQLSGKHLGMTNGTPFKQIIPGLTILFLAWIIMSLFMISSGFSEAFSILFRVIAIIIWSVVVTSGIGAVVLTRFGTREYKKRGPGEVRVHVNIRPTPKPPTPPPLNPNDDE